MAPQPTPLTRTFEFAGMAALVNGGRSLALTIHNEHLRNYMAVMSDFWRPIACSSEKYSFALKPCFNTGLPCIKLKGVTDDGRAYGKGPNFLLPVSKWPVARGHAEWLESYAQKGPASFMLFPESGVTRIVHPAQLYDD